MLSNAHSIASNPNESHCLLSKSFNRSKIIFYSCGLNLNLKSPHMSELQLSDRIKMAHTIEVESATRRKLGLKISWYDIHGENQTQEFSLSEGSKIEF